ncbi:MAG: hydrogenase iron-sulfur subunit [Thermodesulfobacteriota bacterium]
MNGYKPKLVCFSCNFGWGYLTDHYELAARIVNWVPVICSGKIDTAHLFEAFKRGADGVLILACPEGECHFLDGNYRTGKRIYLMQNVLEAFGLEEERVRIVFAADPEGRRIPQLIGEMEANLARLGPVKEL